MGESAHGALGDTGTGGTGASTDTTAASTTDTTAATTTDPGTTTTADTTTTAPDMTATDTTSTDTTTTDTTTTPAAPSAAPVLSADKAKYVAGDTVVLTGTGFTAGETVSAHVADAGASRWMYDGSATAASDGSFTASFQLPSLFASNFTAAATGGPGETASVNITDALNASAFTPSIQRDKADYAPGSAVTISGSGWPANDSLKVFTNDSVGNTWSDTGHPTTDANGEFTYTVTLPNSFVAQYSVVASDANGLSATTSFTDGSLTIHLATVDQANPAPSSINFTYETFNQSSTSSGSTQSTTTSAVQAPHSTSGSAETTTRRTQSAR